VGDEHARGSVIAHGFRLSVVHISILARRNAGALVVQRAVTTVPAGVVGLAAGWPGCLWAVGGRRRGVAADAPRLGLPVLSALIFGAEALGSAGVWRLPSDDVRAGRVVVADDDGGGVRGGGLGAVKGMAGQVPAEVVAAGLARRAEQARVAGPPPGAG
jgi:hypothetical protein